MLRCSQKLVSPLCRVALDGMNSLQRHAIPFTEAAESGANSSDGEGADDLEQSLNSRETLAALKVAYADVSGSDEQIARQLDADPDRRNQVGYAIEALILESGDLPIRLDEMTLYAGAHYEESGATIVYHYDIEQDLSWMSQSEVDALGLQIEQINPNAVCEISLSILAQGFDIAYRYRDANGSELFSDQNLLVLQVTRLLRKYSGRSPLEFLRAKVPNYF